MSKISVIVPVYKVEDYLHQCVDSILDQTFDDYNLILIDDGSPDNCGKICDEYKEQDSRVIVIHQANGGLSAARNAGIDYTFENLDSEWITFIDSDDYVKRDYLQKLYDACSNNNVDISACGLLKIKDGIPVNKHNKELTGEVITMSSAEFFAQKKCGSNLLAVTSPGKLYRKTLFSNQRYPTGKLYEDTFLTHHILFDTDRVAVILENLYLYTVRDESITNSQWNPKKMDRIEAIHERMLYFKDNGYQELYIRDNRLYLLYIKTTITDIKNTDKRRYSLYYKNCRRLLRRECKSSLSRKVISFKEYLGYIRYCNVVLDSFWNLYSIIKKALAHR